MTAIPEQPVTYAWCFGHGLLHTFTLAEGPWCTSTWTPLTGDTKEAAFADKVARYGDAKFIHQLDPETQDAVSEEWSEREGQS